MHPYLENALRFVTAICSILVAALMGSIVAVDGGSCGYSCQVNNPLQFSQSQFQQALAFEKALLGCVMVIT